MTTSTAKATLAVFAPGTHTAMDGRTITFTPEDCIDLANSYDPSVSEAPFVIGHPSLTAPAYGWAERLEYRDGIVYAAPRQVNPAFAEAFNAGSYKKRSLSIYQPDSPGNPKPGHFYARHV
ncbi:peptidase, partial [Klebsiella michiganensis]